MAGLWWDGAKVRHRLKMTCSGFTGTSCVYQVTEPENWVSDIPSTRLEMFSKKSFLHCSVAPRPPARHELRPFSSRKLALRGDGWGGSFGKPGETMNSFSRSIVGPDKSGTKQIVREPWKFAPTERRVLSDSSYLMQTTSQVWNVEGRHICAHLPASCPIADSDHRPGIVFWLPLEK